MSEWPADAASVLLQGAQLSVDGVPAGSIDEVVKRQRLTRLDDLFVALRARRSAWENAHPGAKFGGVAVFWLDASTKLVVVKSIFQTAAFAGYPYLAFAVRPKSDPNALARINATAIVPGPPGFASTRTEEPLALHVNAVEGKDLTLTRQTGDKVISKVSVGERVDLGASAFPILAAKVSREWAAHGKHRSRDDSRFDSAILHTSDSLTLQTMIALTDSIYVPLRDFVFRHKLERVPAFDVSLAVR